MPKTIFCQDRRSVKEKPNTPKRFAGNTNRMNVFPKEKATIHRCSGAGGEKE